MKRAIKAVLALVVIAVYLLALRYVAPSQEPYFVLSTVVIGLVAWLCGTLAGLVTAVTLLPVTQYVYNHFSVSFSFDTFASSPPFIAVQLLAAAALGHLRKDRQALNEKEKLLNDANEHMQTILANVQELGGVHMLCSQCKSIQNEDGTWQDAGTYLKQHTKMEFSHGICPKCADKFHDPDAMSRRT